MISQNTNSGRRILSLVYSTLETASLFKNKTIFIITVFSLGYIAIIQTFLPGYLIFDYTIVASIVLSAYIIHPDKSRRGSYKFLWFTLLFLTLTIISGVKTFYFLTAGFAILFVIEAYAGWIGYLPLFLLCIISPTFKYFNNMLGFPVRLKLSEWSGEILQALGLNAGVIGNVIILDGNEFSVDPACVGLKMMAVSILTGLVIMTFFRREKKTDFSFITITMLSSAIVGFNILANLLRIILLTLFNLPPENFCHDIVGVSCFIVYVISPTWFIIKWVAGKRRPTIKVYKARKQIFTKLLTINLLLFALIAATGIFRFNGKNLTQSNIPQFSAEGYSKEVVQGDVLKLEKPGALIYVKPLSRFYGAEHNPMICWIGSGYSFSRINKQIIGIKEIYTGILKKGSDVIYSAWWFDTGTYQTISQTDWRIRAMKGENFYLININSESEEVLMKEVRKVLK